MLPIRLTASKKWSLVLKHVIFYMVKRGGNFEKPVAFSKEDLFVNTICIALCTSIKLPRQGDRLRRNWGK
jgi:hypothetical protein